MTSPGWVAPTAAERVFALAFLFVATIAWCAFTLAEAGLFTQTRLLGFAIPPFAAGAWLVWRDAHAIRAHARPVSRGHRLGILAVLLLAAALTSRPADYLINGSDASVYLNMAAAIDHRGGLRAEEPLLDILDDASREGLFDRDPLPPSLLNFFPGGIQVAADGRALQPNFFHLVPAAIAGFAALTGSDAGGLLILPLAGLLTIAAVWLLAVRLSSPLAAIIAAGLLTVNFAQIWYGRYPTSEGLTACFLVSGLWFTVRAARDGSRISGLLAGASFGLAACTRLEVLLLVCPLVTGYLVLTAIRGRWTRATTYYALAGALVTSQAVFHALVTTRPYTERILWRVFATDWWYSRTTMLAPALMVAAGVMIWLAWRPWPRMGAARVIRPLLSLLLLAAIVRAWPQLWTGPAPLLFTPVGLAAMACGAVWLALDDPSPEVLLLVAVFVASALVYIDAPRSGRWYPLAWRRLVPVVLPVGLLLVGHIMAVLWRQQAPWRWGAIGLVAFLGLNAVRQSQVLLASNLMAGLRQQLETVAHSLPPDTVLLADVSTPSHFGLSLYFTFGQPVLAVRPAPDADTIDRIASRLAGCGRRLMLALSPHAVAGGLGRRDLANFDVAPAGGVRLRWTELERTANDVPARMQTLSADIEFYSLEARTPAQLPLWIDIGDHDFGWRGDGFHGSEQMGDASARWTTGDAWIDLPAIGTRGDVRVTMRLSAPRPTSFAPVTAAVAIGDEWVFVTPELPTGFTEIAFDLDRRQVERLMRDPSRMTLRNAPFVPRDAGLGDDRRQLGVVVDWVRFKLR